MRKAVATPYIIALIIGVIVVAVLAYWFISSGGKGATIGKEAECTARKAEYCATQTQSALSKVNEVCPKDKSFGITEQCDFCGGIIPGWKPVSQQCPKKEKES